MPQANLELAIIMVKILEITLYQMVKMVSKKREMKELKARSLEKMRKFYLMHKLYSSIT